MDKADDRSQKSEDMELGSGNTEGGMDKIGTIGINPFPQSTIQPFNYITNIK